MKLTITKDEFEAIDSTLQSEYKEEGEGYTLTVEGLEDTGALKRAKEHEVSRRKQAEESLKEIKDRLTAKEDELIEIRKGVIPKDDMDALEKSWKEKLDNQQNDFQQKIQQSESALQSLLVDNVASSMAAEISTVPSLLVPLIKQRLATETADGKTNTRVLDAEGKPTALTVEDLKKEFIANEQLFSIMKGSNASGSGAQGSGNGGGAAKKFSDMSEKDRVDLFKSSPEDYQKIRDAEQTPAM